MQRGVGDRRRQRGLHPTVARPHGAVTQDPRPAARFGTAQIALAGILAVSRALRQRDADQPIAPRIVRAQHGRRHRAVESDVRPVAALRAFEAAPARPAPEGEAAARTVPLARQRETRPEQSLPRTHRSGPLPRPVEDEAVAERVGRASRPQCLRSEPARDLRQRRRRAIVRRARCRLAGHRVERQRLAGERAPHAGRAIRRHASGNALERLFRDGAPEAGEIRRREWIRVGDGPDADGIVDGRPRRLGDDQFERLVGVVVRIIQDVQNERFVGVSGEDAQTVGRSVPAHGPIVVSCRRRDRGAVPRVGIETDRCGRRFGQVDGEGHLAAFRGGGVPDRQRGKGFRFGGNTLHLRRCAGAGFEALQLLSHRTPTGPAGFPATRFGGGVGGQGWMRLRTEGNQYPMPVVVVVGPLAIHAVISTDRLNQGRVGSGTCGGIGWGLLCQR